MTFPTDVVSDRDNVFLNTLEFAETATYRVASTDTSTSITVQVEDGADTVQDDAFIVRLSSATVAAPQKGDQVIRSGEIYTVRFVSDDYYGVYTLECEREEEIT